VRNYYLSEWTRRFRLATAIIGCAAALMLGLATAPAALADPGAENAVLLDPFDPVPEIQFRHFGADCFSNCGYSYGYGCYHECDYRCHYGCYRRRHHYHGESWRDQRSDWQAFRYDDQSYRYDRFSNRYERQSREWDAIVNGGWFDNHHYWHDGHGRWRDGGGIWHQEEGRSDPRSPARAVPSSWPNDADGPPPPPTGLDDDDWENGGLDQ